MTVLDANIVALAPAPGGYPQEIPFHPSEPYPEYPFGQAISKYPNPVYAAVRHVFADLGLDSAHLGQMEWNPLGELIRPGDKVVIKPNWVLHCNQGDGGTDCLVTHPAFLRAVMDYVLRARPGSVVVGDAPVQGCDWDLLMNLGFKDVIEFEQSRGLPVIIKDFRRTILHEAGDLKKVETDLRPLSEYVEVDLGSQSLLEPLSDSAHKFRVTMYDPRKMRQNHAPGRHRYLVARDVLEADVIINLPKLKTHKKAGITAALKNLVGINGNKDYLPHHRKGPPCFGGDNYEKFSLLKWAAEEMLDVANMFFLKMPFIYRWFNRGVYYLLVADIRMGGLGEVEGSWYGNDTVWRMCLDLNRVLLYADKNGYVREDVQRRMLNVIDAVTAGQGEGPLKSDPLELEMVIGSLNPAAADWVGALLMRLDPLKIPIIRNAFQPFKWPLCHFDADAIQCVLAAKKIPLNALASFSKPARCPRGWQGHCERQP